MDKFNLRISFFSNYNIINNFNSADKIDRLSLECTNACVNNTSSYNKADVIVFDIDMPKEEIETIYKNRASYAVVVLICTSNNISKINNYDRNDVFDIWLIDEPLLFEYRIYQFLHRMRDYLDAELAKNQLDTLIDSVPDLIWFKDVIGAHIKVNESFCKTVNKTKEQIKDRGHCYIWDLDPSEYEQGEYVCMETEEVVIEEQGTFLFDEKVKISDEMRQLKTYKSAIVGRNGETIGTVGLARDVTDIWNTHAEFKALINHLPFPMMILNDDYEFVSANDKFDNIFGAQEDISAFNLKDFGQKHFGFDISMINNKDATIECNMLDSGKIRFFSIDKSAIYDVFNELNGFFFIFDDITTQKEYEQKLKLISQTDELTGLANRIGIRKYFDANYSVALENKIPISIMMLDIDYFKNYNDKYGHVSGDNVLSEVGKILNNFSQDENIFTARYGGEEFLIISVGKTFEGAIEIANTIYAKIKNLNIINEGSEVSNIVTPSIGLVHYNVLRDSVSVSELIKSADEQLYIAKEQGRDQVVVKLI